MHSNCCRETLLQERRNKLKHLIRKKQHLRSGAWGAYVFRMLSGRKNMMADTDGRTFCSSEEIKKYLKFFTPGHDLVATSVFNFLFGTSLCEEGGLALNIHTEYCKTGGHYRKSSLRACATTKLSKLNSHHFPRLVVTKVKCKKVQAYVTSKYLKRIQKQI